MKRLVIILLTFILGNSLILNAQQVYELSLKEAKSYALEHNYDIKVAKNNVEIAKKW